MKPLSGERVLYESAGGKLKVTTHRVRYDRQCGGTGAIKSIMLDEVASCSMLRRTHPILLILVATCLLGGLLFSFQVGAGAFAAGAFIALILAVAYLLSREQVLVIASAGATVYLNTQGWNVQNIRDLIDQIEAAKNARYLLVRPQAGVASRP